MDERGKAEARHVYSGHVISVELETVQLPNAEWVELEIVRHPGGAAVVAVDHEDYVVLLRQYRHAAGGWLWELPAGKLDAGEAPLTTAQRELVEEAGVTAAAWHDLGRVVSSPGVFTEVVHLFLARELHGAEGQREHGECFEVHRLPRREAVAMALSGEVSDAKTIVGLLRADALLHDPG